LTPYLLYKTKFVISHLFPYVNVPIHVNTSFFCLTIEIPYFNPPFPNTESSGQMLILRKALKLVGDGEKSGKYLTVHTGIMSWYTQTKIFCEIQ
jgi:hypothetical protein